MSLTQYRNAFKLVKEDKVKLNFSADLQRIYGEVKTPTGIYEVIIDKEIDSCTCEFKSF